MPLQQIKSSTIKNTINFQKTNFPKRTSDYAKCERDLSYIIDAFSTDIKNKNKIQTMKIAGMFWDNNKRQVSDYSVELKMHDFMLEYIFENGTLLDDEIVYLKELNTFLSNTIHNGPDQKTDILSTVYRSQRCQRNWDLSKEVDSETINWLMEIGYTTPTKQNLDTFEIVCISNREVIKEFSKAATNPPYNLDALSDHLRKEIENGRVQNPQTDSNLLFLFFLKPEQRTSALRADRERGEPENDAYWRACTNLEIGLAASAIGIAANSIGMKSGFCRCIDHDLIPTDILKTYNINPYHLEVMLGIGYPLYNDHTRYTDGKHYSESYPKIIPRKLII